MSKSTFKGWAALLALDLFVIIPICYIMLIVIGVFAVKTAKKLEGTDGHKYVTWVSVIMWLSVAIIGFGMFLSIFLAPFVLPILNIFTTMLEIVFLGLFITATVLTFKAYAHVDKSSSGGKEALKTALISLFTSIILAVFLIISTIRYHRKGGLTGQIAMQTKTVGKVAEIGGIPEGQIIQQLGSGIEGGDKEAILKNLQDLYARQGGKLDLKNVNVSELAEFV